MSEDKIQVVGLTNPKMSPKTKAKIFGALIGIFVLVIGVGAGIYLVSQNQNPQEKAAVNYGRCNEPGAEACPGTDGVLRSCHPPESDNTPVLSLCNEKGRIEFCGTRNYCCPAPGGTWTADMTACATPTPAPTATGTPSPSPTVRATATATSTATTAPTSTATTASRTASPTTAPTKTATAKPTATATTSANKTATPTTSSKTATPTTASTSVAQATATAVPVPVTGASWPTIIGGGFGIIMILVSIALAL